MSDNRLRAKAQAGDIKGLYLLIQEDPHVLEGVDLTPFVDTPLHDAASVGHLQFAIEIMTLKPSFAWKLNPQGFTPIHLALQQGHNRMVLRFVSINKDLVRAKGRKGRTPLHLATKKGEIELLTKFLLACPDSIEDVTVRGETALHIAVRHGQLESLQVLVGWLKRTSQKGAVQQEKTILNWKDEEGNTILHVSARENNLQMVQLLVKTKLDLKVKNFEERSALDIATNEEIRGVLVVAGANLSDTDVATYADILKSKMTLMDKIFTFILRITSDITEEQRNAYLIIAALVTTATYQSVLSPPGGVYQANAGDNNANTTSLNSTAIATQWYTGKSVLSASSFFSVSYLNTFSFLVSIMVIFILTPAGIVGTIMLSPIYFFAFSYVCSMIVISPNKTITRVDIATLFPILLFMYLITYFASKRANKRPLGRDSAGRNRW